MMCRRPDAFGMRSSGDKSCRERYGHEDNNPVDFWEEEVEDAFLSLVVVDEDGLRSSVFTSSAPVPVEDDDEPSSSKTRW